MNIALWIVQGLLGAIFLMSGVMKFTQPKAKLAEKMPWVNGFSVLQVKLIGLSQLLAALGLVLPMLLNIAPVLTPLAATGLVLTMLSAAILHYRHGEMEAIRINAVLGSLALFVAIGRFFLA